MSLQTNQNILLVEDDRITQEIHKYFLKKLKFEATIAESGQTALDFINKNDYYAVILDLGLPGINGEQVLKKIRQDDSQRIRPLSVIVVTAHADQTILNQLYSNYRPDFIFIKPVSYCNFQNALNTLKNNVSSKL